jgi:hypothetical protein
MEFPIATTPNAGMSEMNKALFLFQNFQTRAQEEINRQSLVIDQQQKMIGTLILEKKDLVAKLAKKLPRTTSLPSKRKLWTE